MTQTSNGEQRTKYKVPLYRGFEKVELVEVEGREVSVSPFLSAIIHRQPESNMPIKERYWVVAEMTTGHSIATGRTQKLAIEKATSVLKTRTREEIEKAINKGKPKEDMNTSNGEHGVGEEMKETVWSKSTREEIIGILWFILAALLFPSHWSMIPFFFGTTSTIASIYFAIKKHGN